MTDFTEILPVGEQNAMPAKSLMIRLNIDDSRTLRKQVSQARREGQLICTAPGGGYFQPHTAAELRRWVNTMHQTVMAMFEDMAVARAVLDDLDARTDTDINAGESE